MPFALLVIGITLIVVAVRNTQDEFIVMLYRDFTGPGNFLYWVVALVVVGSIGYIPKLKGLSDAFLVLILLSLVLSKGNPDKSVNPSGGFFKLFTDALADIQNPQAPPAQKTATGGLIDKLGGLIPPATRGTGPNGSWTGQDKIDMGRQPVSCPPGMTYRGPLLGCR